MNRERGAFDPAGDAMPSPRLVELDALRGIAASTVLLFHYTWQGVHVLPGIRLVPMGVAWGHYGVELFFAISGFVIFMTLDRTSCTLDFLISRFARLFPAYWFAVGLTSVGVLLLGSPSLAQPPGIIAANLSMLQSFLYLPSVDGAYWSLAVELGFYVCMLALWRLGMLNRIEYVLVGWIALKLLWWAVPALPSRVGALFVERYIPWFAIGIVAYRFRNCATGAPQKVMVLLVGLASIAIAEKPDDVVVYIAVCAIFAALVTGYLGFLNQPVLLWLGALSYPFYLVHQNLGYAMIAWLERAGLPAWISLVCAIGAVLAAAQIVHSFIERPSLRLIRRWWRIRQEARAHSHAAGYPADHAAGS